MEEVGCDIDLEEAFPFGLEQETGWKNTGRVVMVSEVH